MLFSPRHSLRPRGLDRRRFIPGGFWGAIIVLLGAWLLGGDGGRCSGAALASEPADRLAEGVWLIERRTEPVRHGRGAIGPAGPIDSGQQARYELFQTERAGARWFAALVATEPTDSWTVTGRFHTWGGLVDFLQERDALVETWAHSETGSGAPRRVTAVEEGQWRARGERRPTTITAVYRDLDDLKVITNRLEFGFDAAGLSLVTLQNHARHRQLQRAASGILGARAANGQLSAQAQWLALKRAHDDGLFPFDPTPPWPEDDRDLFTAFEYERDIEGSFVRPLRVWRESEIQPRVEAGMPELVLGAPGRAAGGVAVGFTRRGVSDEWDPITRPITGQDMVELRIRDPGEPDPRRWHVLEFGEPALIRQVALSRFALLAAHLERQRKAVAVKRANLALIAEPIIAGINIGGGVAGLGFPAGEAVRFAYNVAVTPLLTRAPTVRQMRELFTLMAARDRDPSLRTRPGDYLSRDDIKRLRQAGGRLSAEEVRTYLDRMGTRELEAMLRVAQQGAADDRVTHFLNLLTSIFKVTGASEQDGVLRDLFNNVYFSMNGEINLSTLFLVAIGQRDMTPLSGVSLESLAKGEGPAQAWAQYFTLSVDFRAIVNTVARWTKPDLAGKELEKPFPYAPHLGDLAAYEFRAFGFPFLMFYKRGLTRADARAYAEEYAYGLLGPRVVERFHTREDLDAEIRAGRMTPLGYVRVRDGRGGWRSTHLAVFVHRIPEGKHRGRTAIVVYGLQAYEQGSVEMARALERFRLYERVQAEGGVIEQVVRAQHDAGLRAEHFEPVIRPGAAAVEERYAPVLGHLIELRRLQQRRAWGVGATAVEQAEETALRQRLTAHGIELESADPRLEVDNSSSSFIFRQLVDGAWQDVKWVLVPSPVTLERDRAAFAEGAQVDTVRRRVAAGELPAVVLLNSAVSGPDGRLEAGPLLRDEAGNVIGAGVMAEPDAVNRFLDRLGDLPVTDQARLRFSRFAGTLLELDPYGTGPVGQVFVMIEFAPGKIRRERVDPVTGEREVRMYERGLWREAITDRRLLQLDYDAEGLETGSRTYANRGSRLAPEAGVKP